MRVSTALSAENTLFKPVQIIATNSTIYWGSALPLLNTLETMTKSLSIFLFSWTSIGSSLHMLDQGSANQQLVRSVTVVGDHWPDVDVEAKRLRPLCTLIRDNTVIGPQACAISLTIIDSWTIVRRRLSTLHLYARSAC
jgi:hypothetical protein